jgi:hypothetical protein
MLLSVLIYSFARISAALTIWVKDYFPQGYTSPRAASP